MHPGLPREIAVGIGAADGEGGALDPRLLPILTFEKLDLVAVSLRPAQVHAEQHLRPVLRLGAAGAGVDDDDGVLVVVGAGELEGKLQLFELGRQATEERLDLRIDLPLRQELPPGGQLLGVRAQPRERLQAALQAPPLLEDRGALRRVVPEFFVFELVVDLGEPTF
jgi:hypothetical protein